MIVTGGAPKLTEKPKTFGNLVSEVIRKNLCMFCGACMAACPVSVLAPDAEQPTIKGRCLLCQVCYYQCPRTGYDTDAASARRRYTSESEVFVFGRTSRDDETIGQYRSCLLGRSRDEEILKVCQDGGVVSSLILHGLRSRRIDAAVGTVAGPESSWKPRPLVIADEGDVLRSAGTKYTPSPNLMGLMSAVEEYMKERVAVVGTPCQVQALRRMQTSPLGCRKLTDHVALVIGLFCMEIYSYDRLVKEFLLPKGVDPKNVTKFAIKKGRFIAYSDGTELLSTPLKEVDDYIRAACKPCTDLTSELADISVGGMASSPGWSIAIARTQLGEDLLKEAADSGILELRPFEETKLGLNAVSKLSLAKKRRGEGA
jgi:coenzyme F420 hydrogenase subunit beta